MLSTMEVKPSLVVYIFVYCSRQFDLFFQDTIKAALFQFYGSLHSGKFIFCV